MYDNDEIGKKIDNKIDESQKRVKQTIINHHLTNTNTIKGVIADKNELYGNRDPCNQPYIYDRPDYEYKTYWELQLSSFKYDKNETPISKIGDKKLQECEDVRAEIDRLLGTNPIKYGKVKSKKKRSKVKKSRSTRANFVPIYVAKPPRTSFGVEEARMRKSMTRQTRRLARSKKKLSLAKRRSSIFYTPT